ncbi:hypothetical protein PIGHUM_04603 [Pigmentiphaga humi]|uniref:Uncharacterized protein n=1 Tax=Pigmentiphaga humi TaxID=2478468 RepID=A0A3P4B8E6_9BURK|nr:hypothetical protein [Pigmentiphaga humi]VCU72503.1 hypothetical protein PIGHUM_04603 [Pigmentiphaga humi]
MFFPRDLPTSFGDWLEQQQESGAPGTDISAATTVDQRLRAALVICTALFASPSEKTVVAVFERINALAEAQRIPKPSRSAAPLA